jgi:transposase
MKFIQGQNRDQLQLFPVSIDQALESTNETRVIDAFINSLSLKDYGFRMDFIDNGRPAYHPADLLKLYIYGYMNHIRSSRDLERECKRNIEVMWLMKCLQPDHNTISNFRRDNPVAIKKVFRATVQLAKHFDLIGGKLLAGDSTKLRAQNSKKNNYNQSKIDRHVEYIDRKLEEYNQILSQQDGDKKEAVQAEISKHTERRENYKKLEQQLHESKTEQISTSDPESRQMIVRNNITEVAYNVQTTVDSKHNLPIDYKVTNNNDSKAMGDMVKRTATILKETDFTILYDKGYHTGSELKTAQELGVTPIVAIPEISSHAPDTSYDVVNFIYVKPKDFYICPQGHELHSNGKWYDRNRGKYRDSVKMKQYKTSQCKTCPARKKCTTNKDGRVIERSEYAENVALNRKYVEANPELYKKRQAIVEHPYGTIKRQWGYSYIITKKGKLRASADVGFIFVAYNLRRLINILGLEVFLAYLRKLALFFTILLIGLKRKISIFESLFFSEEYFHSKNIIALNRLLLIQNSVNLSGF